VNRLEMHPLDEAALFGRMAEKGMSVEEIAKHYARSPSAIYKRLRLVSLTEELKGMFRDGQLNIGGAAVLAELPEEDQKEFYNLYGQEIQIKPDVLKDQNYDIEAIEPGKITEFLYKKQKNKIKDNMSKICKNCAKRTHNEHNALFEEYRYLDDVCLDGDCYRAKWYEMISAALKAQIVQTGEAGLKTDEKIFFEGDVVEQIYKKANKVRFKIGKEDIEFEVLREKNYERTGETNRKKDACWLVHVGYTGKIDVRRVGYKEKQKEKPAEKESGAGKSDTKGNTSLIKNYGREALEAVAQELQKPSAAEVAKKLDGKKVSTWTFNNDIKKLVFGRVVAMIIEKESTGKLPAREYLEMFLESADQNGGYGDHNYREKMYDDFQKKCMKGLFRERNIKNISAGLDEDAQKLFHFLLVSTLSDSDVPDLDDIKEIGKEKHVDGNDWYIFWKYAGMSVEEYTELYLQAAKDVAAKALKPKEIKYLPGHNPGSARGQGNVAYKRAQLKKKAQDVAVSESNEDEDREPF